MVKRRALWPVGVVWVSVLVLSGCVDGGGPAVESSPPVVTSESVDASPSPSMSTEERLLAMIPEEAKGDDLMAAEAMAKFFITLHPGLYQGEDPALFEFLCLPESVFCSSSLAVTQERLSEGTVQVGGDAEIPDQVSQMVLTTEDDGVETAFIGFRFVELPHSTLGSDGSTLRTSDGGEYEAAVALRHQDGLWRIHALEVF